MKKFFLLFLTLVLLLCGGCAKRQENTETRFLLDTFLTVTADCDKKDLSAVFDLCADYEKEFSRTVENSTVFRLNNGETLTVSDGFKTVLERSLHYADVSEGRFDITVCPAARLWDFEKATLPDRKALANAVRRIDYRKISIEDDHISLGGTEIDLGGIAKGYIADRLAENLQQNGAENGVVNFTSSIVIFGKTRKVHIRDPFSDDHYAATLSVKDVAVSTSGIYERCFEKDGILYHHILDPKTGYGVETDLASVTVISDNAMDGDAIATVCILFGLDRAKEWVETLPDTEAVFIDKNGHLSYTGGITEKNDLFVLKNS